MHKRANRLIVAAVLMAAALAGGFFVFSAHQEAEAILASSADVAGRLERLIAAAGEIASAQQAYVAAGQPEQPWVEQNTTLLEQFANDLTVVRSRLRSADAPRIAKALSDNVQTLSSINEKARLDLQENQQLLAADLIFNEGRDTVAALIASLRGLMAAERTAATTDRASLLRQQWGVLAIVALTWLGGLMILVPLPPNRLTAESASSFDLRSTPTPSLPDDLEEPQRPRMAPAVDMTAAAQVFTSLAQVVDAAMLPPVLARAAAVLDARGIILWMGAGDELFPALVHGYEKSVIDRLGPLTRNAENATAEAWRTGQMRIVASTVASHGALAAPLFSIDGCVGVLAAEVRHEREHDPSTRALVTMFAAQLACIVPVWPGASLPATDVGVPDALASSGTA